MGMASLKLMKISFKMPVTNCSTGPDKQCEEHRSSHKRGLYDFKKQCMDMTFSDNELHEPDPSENDEYHIARSNSSPHANASTTAVIHRVPQLAASPKMSWQRLQTEHLSGDDSLESGITIKDNKYKYSILKAHSLLGPDQIWAVLMEKDGDTDFDEEQDVKPSQKFVEALCPVDHSTLDISGKLITDTTDQELNAILIHISRMKEN
ncbi:hypothetical protein EV421DRAFT_1739261 [Armillaria borealis]|uniref:Uncharacterized protein n=1 Tax=Armillaria borealis TaxID=47425 RepID=A0AA39J938_9AGAR|nr:hypothetical protein EV421DRAFT_1739261 [Armillaria borealis]